MNRVLSLWAVVSVAVGLALTSASTASAADDTSSSDSSNASNGNGGGSSAAGGSGGAAASGTSCLKSDAVASLNACPNTGPTSFNVGGHGKAPQMSFHGKVEEL